MSGDKRTNEFLRLGRIAMPLVGGVLLFLGERVLDGGVSGVTLSSLGAFALVVALVGELAAPVNNQIKAYIPPKKWGVGPRAAFVVAVGIYFAAESAGTAPSDGINWAGVLGWGWLLLLLVGGPVFLVVELAWRAQRENPIHDENRLARAAHAGAFLGLLLALVVTLNFVFHKLGWETDLAYFKTSAPSQATLEVMAGTEKPVEIGVFFASGNTVQPMVRAYFQSLADQGGKISLKTLDADINPVEARDYKVRGNGNVVLRQGEAKEQINIGESLDRARKNLKNLDQLVMSALLKVTRPERTVYFTVGHGEFNENSRGNTSVMHRYNRLQKLFAGNNLKVKPLGLSEGLGNKIPEDAGLVVVLGPKRGFLPGEAATLKAYVESGGRMMVFLESSLPTAVGAPVQEPKGSGLRGVLESFGIVHNPTVLAHDRIFARRSFTKADHTLLVTVGYQNHDVSRSLRQLSKENALLLLGSGEFEKAEAPKGYRLAPILKGMRGTWADKDGNFVFEPGKEQRGEPLLVQSLSALGEKAGPRIIAFADADLALDFLMQNRANETFITGAIAWLLDDGRPMGMAATEEDRKIIHAEADQLVLFYLPVFGVPLLVIVVGFVMAGRRLRRQREGKA